MPLFRVVSFVIFWNSFLFFLTFYFALGHSQLPQGDQPCIFTWRTDAWSTSTLVIRCNQMTHWKSPWCWERLRAEGEEGIREWDGWMTSPTQWTWTWANSRRWWGTERPGMLQSRGHKEVDTTGRLNDNNTALTMSWQLQVNSKGTQPHVHMCPFSLQTQTFN